MKLICKSEYAICVTLKELKFSRENGGSQACTQIVKDETWKITERCDLRDLLYIQIYPVLFLLEDFLQALDVIYFSHSNDTYKRIFYRHSIGCIHTCGTSTISIIIQYFDTRRKWNL